MTRTLRALMEEHIQSQITASLAGKTSLRIGVANIDDHMLGVFLRFLESLELDEPGLDCICPPLIRSYQNFIRSFLLDPTLIVPTLSAMKEFCHWLYRGQITSTDFSELINISEKDVGKPLVLKFKPRRSQ